MSGMAMTAGRLLGTYQRDLTTPNDGDAIFRLNSPDTDVQTDSPAVGTQLGRTASAKGTANSGAWLNSPDKTLTFVVPD